MTRHAIMMILASAASFTALACGPSDVEEVVGSYQGSSELFNATNFGMNTQSVEDVITITPLLDNESEVLIGLDSDCALRATVSEGELTIASQECRAETQNTSDVWVYEGDGSADGESLTLDLDGTFERVYMAGPLMTPPLKGTHSLKFEGTRQR